MQEQLRLRQIEVELELCARTSSIVLGNAIQLEQVFINLLTNARDALADAPRKTIRIASARTRTTEVTIAVRRHRPGIPPGLEQRIFDPFFTTKEVGTGTGLGLSITYGIVKEHGGLDRRSASGPGEGACFVIELPLAGEVPEEPVLMSARILIVDDDPALLEALPDALAAADERDHDRHLRHRRPTRSSRSPQTDYDAIVTDIKMPGMDGLALLDEIKQRASRARRPC